MYTQMWHRPERMEVAEKIERKLNAGSKSEAWIRCKREAWIVFITNRESAKRLQSPMD